MSTNRENLNTSYSSTITGKLFAVALTYGRLVGDLVKLVIDDRGKPLVNNLSKQPPIRGRTTDVLTDWVTQI